MVPVINGRGFFSVMSFSAGPYSPLLHSSIYSGISCAMGQPPLQGAVKQSIQGTFFSLLRLGRGLMGLTWWTSVWLALLISQMACVSVPAKGLYAMGSTFSTIWYSRL